MFIFNLYFIKASCFSKQPISLSEPDKDAEVLFYYGVDPIEYALLVFVHSETTII